MLSMVGMNQRRSVLSRIGRWTAELVLVFVGVYAAFWLNNYHNTARTQTGAIKSWRLSSKH